MAAWLACTYLCLVILLSLSLVRSTDAGSVTENQPLGSPQQSTPEPYQPNAWQLQRHSQLSQIARQGDTDLVFLGDSITQGWETTGKKVWSTYYGRRHAANFGMSGDQTQHVLWRLQHVKFEMMSPKVVILLIGIDNSYAGNSAEQIAAGVQAIIWELRRKVPHSKILLFGIFPTGETSDTPARQRALAANVIVKDFADGEMVRYLDIGHRFLREDGTIPKELMPDFLHLSADGNALWAESMEPVLNQMMGMR